MRGNPLNRSRMPEHEDEGWLITFADMCVLLMSFFVLMWALASADPKQLDKLAKSLYKEGFYNDAMPQVDPAEDLKKKLSLAVGEKGYDAYIAASENQHGVDVEIASSAFFENGSAKFTARALPMLKVISDLIVPLSNQDITIEIEGHTDDTPIATEQYPSNWELSAARASNVVRYLVAQKFPAAKLRAVGLGDTHPKAPNRDAAGNPLPANQNLNRRVIIKILRGEDN